MEMEAPFDGLLDEVKYEMPLQGGSPGNDQLKASFRLGTKPSRGTCKTSFQGVRS